MLIVNDTQLLLAGVVSLNEPCPYCCAGYLDQPFLKNDT